MTESDRPECCPTVGRSERCEGSMTAGWQWRRQLLRIVRSPHTVVRLTVDWMMVPLWMRCLGVRMEPGCSFAGLPIITRAPGASIALGNRVRILSRADSNPAGLPHPTILAAVGEDSAIVIGDQTGISGASIVARSSITIGRHVLIGAGACIWDTDFHPLSPDQRQRHPTRDAGSRPIRIEHDAFIGARAIVLKGVTIGWGAVVGAGAVVARDVAPCDIVAGNPARVVGSAAEQSPQPSADR